MKKHFLIYLAFLVSCSSKEKQSPKPIDYKLKLEQLEAEIIRKDTLLTESIIYFNEIERNLSSIEFTENEIKQFSESKLKESPSDKQALFEKIKRINALRIENTKKMKALQRRLDTIDVAQDEFKELIARLQKKIQSKNETIAELETKLKNGDDRYQKLFVGFQEQQQILNEKESQNKEIEINLNTVYYAMGSEEELDQKGVINLKKKIFSSNKLSFNEKWNDSYFTKVDKNKFQELSFQTKKGYLTSNHPVSSYAIEREGKTTKLIIKDVNLFWKFTKYLIVVTD